MGKQKPASAAPAPAPPTQSDGGGGPGGGRKPKGHRQKGAGAVIADKGPIERGGVVVQSWQRVPTTLLSDWTQREKRPRAIYHRMPARGGGVRFKVVLPDPKGVAERALVFAPTVDSDDATVAKENAALLALLHLMPTLPLERKLPEPYKTTWVQSAGGGGGGGGREREGGGGGGGSRADEKKSVGGKGRASATKQQMADDTSRSVTTTAAERGPASSGGGSEGGEVVADGKCSQKRGDARYGDGGGSRSGGGGDGGGAGGGDSDNGRLVQAGPKAVVLESAYRFASRKDKLAHEEQRKHELAKRKRARQWKRYGREDYRIMMSTKMRRLVEEALGIQHADCDADSEEDDDDTDNDEDGVADDEGNAEQDEDDRMQTRMLTKRVCEMGFAEAHVRRALRALRRGQGGGVEGLATDDVVDYLLLHLKEDDLPTRFDPRGTNMEVLVHSNGTQGVAGTARSQADGAVAELGRTYGLREPDCATLAAMAGADATDDHARRILARALYRAASGGGLEGGEGEGEAEDLLAARDVVDAHSDADGVQSVEEELEALRAIYGDDQVVVREVEGVDDRGTTEVRVTLEGALMLEAWVPRGYPSNGALPVVLVRGPGVSSRLQLDLAERAAALRGHAMLYELTLVASESASPTGAAPLIFASSSESMPLAPDMRTTQPPRPPSPTLSTATTSSAASSSSLSCRSTADRRKRRPGGSGYGFWGSSKCPETNADLQAMLENRAATADGHKMSELRKRLPAAGAREEFLKLLAAERVVLVTGETGCGKTTQIPQFIMEEAELSGRGTSVKIIVSQPRRIAAIGVATRVAEERGEEVGRGSIGYMIRGENKTCASTRLAFCTTGIILRRLQEASATASTSSAATSAPTSTLTLGGVTHLIMDEVHERNLDSDFLLVLVKRLLSSSPTLRVVLMSATMDSERVARYMRLGRGSPVPPRLNIPGFTHPVTDVWLDQICGARGFLGYTPPALRKMFEDDPLFPCGDLEKEGAIDYRLIGRLVRYVCGPEFASHHPDASDGSVLVFLPGVGEITRVVQDLRDESHIRTLPLHGALSGSDQAQVFRAAPRGKKKVVCSTNVAETSITIPDVTIVIDCGRVKESGYDPQSRMACLVEGWTSKDSIRQRRGRAGRVRPGVAFHLITGSSYAKLPQHSTPEVHRTSLEQMVLQVMTMLRLDDPRGFLSDMLDPPDPTQVTSALDTLKDVQAIADTSPPPPPSSHSTHTLPHHTPAPTHTCATYEVTPLGRHLASLPCPVRLGKMLVYGAVLGVLDPLLSVAAGMLARSPFLSTVNFDAERKAAVEAARGKLVGPVGKSDHLLLAVVVSKFEAMGGRERREWCGEVGLSFERMAEMQQLRRQLAGDMATLGFSADAGADGARTMLDSINEKGSRAYWRLARSAVCIGLYPNIVKVVRPPPRFAQVAGGAWAVDAHARQLKFFMRKAHDESYHSATAGQVTNDQPVSSTSINGGGGGGSGGQQQRQQWLPEERVFIHPSSINFNQGSYTVPWLVCGEVVRTSKVFVRDATEVSPYALLVAARALRVVHPQSEEEGHTGRILLEEDGWVRFAAVGRIAALVTALKKRVNGLLEEKVVRPEVDISASPEARALVRLIVTEGLG